MQDVLEQHQELINTLQQQLSFQDDLIDQLNTAVARQEQRLLLLAEQLAVMQRAFAQLRSERSDWGSPADAETPPPHY